jgi:energy-coupling factor transporter ATP-binding protein EcfA2
MHVHKIQISNVRGFREVELDLTRPDGSLAGWTVLAGRNGSGKSTLLKAIALAVAGPEAARALYPSFADWMRAGSREAAVGVHLALSPEEPQQLQETRLSWKRDGASGEPTLLGTRTQGERQAFNGAHDFDVYLSYDSADKAEVLEVAQQLRSRGIRPWIDDWELKPGVDWKTQSEEALLAAPALAVFVGERFGKSRFVQRELDVSRIRGLPIIPVLLRSAPSPPELPTDLARLRWVNLCNTDSDPLDLLIWGITGRNPHRDDERGSSGQDMTGGREKLFLAGYGPYRRLTGHAVDAQRLMDGPEPIARVVSLFREDASLVESVGWLKEIYLQRLENKPGAFELEKTVLDLLDDGLLPDDVRVDQVDSDGLWVFQRGVRLPLRELSDGYRTVAALVMDIVRHLHRSFGMLTIERAEENDGQFWRVLHVGVVLIDEVDLHLHIAWQKRIGFWLKRHFPNIQFLVTTHSPFICQAADPRGLVRLPAPGEERSAEHVSEDLYNTVVHGSLDEAILTELFGLESLYSRETEQLRDAVAHLEAKVQTGTATNGERQELLELRSKLPRTMSSSVDQALRALLIEE